MMICITCVDALLGTDMERVCRKAEKSRTSGSTMLHVRADKRRKKAADGACTSVFIFPSGAKEEKRKCGEFIRIFFPIGG